MAKILVTGFEPFDGNAVNPSQQIAEALAMLAVPGHEIATAVLPVDRYAAPRAVVAAIDAQRPAVALLLGQATGRAALAIERVAVNLLDFRIPDNAGNLASEEAVAPDGPAAYFATVPVRAMYDAVRAAGVPVELSLSAGAYLCNQVLYVALHHVAQRGLPVRVGFIHVPTLPEQAAERSARTPSMSLETMIRGVSAALSVL